MKRKVWKKIVIITVIFAAVYGLATILLDMQRSIEPAETSSTIVASMPIAARQPIRVKVAGDILFKLDTGSDLSCITPDDLAKLRAMDVNIREVYIPVLGVGSDGLTQAKSKRYVIDLPLEFVEPVEGNNRQIARNPKLDNKLLNAEFVLVEGEGEMSAFGIDILRHFAVEYLHDPEIIRLHSSRPEGYEDFSQLRYSMKPGQDLLPGRRYFIDLEVDHFTDSYFIDSGLRRAAIKLPMKRAKESKRNLESDSLESYLGVFEAKTDHAWIECGNRAGSYLVYYCDNEEADYSINPFNFFTQDMLLDFPSSSIALHPYVVLPSRKFFEGDSLEFEH